MIEGNMDIANEDSKNEFGYHYTSLDTLLKILDSVQEGKFTMHASGIFAMNDPTEFRYGYEKMFKLLPKMEEELQIDNDKKLSTFWDKYGLPSYRKQCYDFHVNMMKEYFKCPFVVSLSRNRDSIPLWRMYGNDGMGVALGIDIRIYLSIETTKDGKEVMRLHPSDVDKISAIDVVYDEIPPLHVSACMGKSEYLQYKKSIANITNEKEIDTKRFNAITQMMMFTAPFIKHKAYEYEKESRIITIHKGINDILFKKGLKDNQIPYVEIKLPIETLKEIIVGPCADLESVRQCLTIKMLQKGIENVEISKSDVPYRN